MITHRMFKNWDVKKKLTKTETQTTEECYNNCYVCSMFITTLLPDVIRYKQLEVTKLCIYCTMYKEGQRGNEKSYQRIMYGFHRKTFFFLFSSEKERGK